MENLRSPKGAVKNRKRVGRGPGSGTGKTSTRGENGQKSRKGGTIRLGFEGGQTPLYRRLPKKGFKNSRFRDDYNEINVSMLDKFTEGSSVNIEEYKKMNMISSGRKKIKILGNGEITKKLDVYANKFSKSAVSKIEAAGGKVLIITKEDKKQQEDKEQKGKDVE